MNDKDILVLLFNNNVLRTHLLDYSKCVCNTESASSLLEISAKYFSDPLKSLDATIDDFNTIFTAEFSSDSEELSLWKEIKETKISDLSIVEPAVTSYISKRLKEYFLPRHLQMIAMMLIS